MLIDEMESGNLHGPQHFLLKNNPINFVVIERKPKLTQFNLVNWKSTGQAALLRVISYKNEAS